MAADWLTFAKALTFILLVLPCFVAYIVLGHAYLIPRLKSFVTRCDQKKKVVCDLVDGPHQHDHSLNEKKNDGSDEDNHENPHAQLFSDEHDDIEAGRNLSQMEAERLDNCQQNAFVSEQADDEKNDTKSDKILSNDKLSFSDDDDLERVTTETTTTTIHITTVTSKKTKPAKKQGKKSQEPKITKPQTSPVSPHASTTSRHRSTGNRKHQAMEMLDPLPQLARQARAAESKEMKPQPQTAQDHPYSPFQGLNLLHHHYSSILTNNTYNCSSNRHARQGPACLTPACRGGIQQPFSSRYHYDSLQQTCRQQSIRRSPSPAYQPPRSATPIPHSQPPKNDLDFSLFDRRFSSVLGVSPTTR